MNLNIVKSILVNESESIILSYDSKISDILLVQFKILNMYCLDSHFMNQEI